MSEDDVQRRVVDEARWAGWRVAHFRTAQTAGSWRTPVEADGKGYPDLTLVHGRAGLVAFIECKGERGRLRPEQQAWLDDLEQVERASEQVLVSVVTPRNLDQVCAILRTWPRGVTGA